jgi:tRNA threonylcarbamoyladenosine biosynthesis protein TsaB
MTMLALEFSSDRRSVAVARDGVVLAEAVQHTESRATAAFALIEKVLADGKILREEIEMIAVGLGPGSYTGIRAAIALAQGWQLATGVKLLGLSSAEVIAAQAQAEGFTGTASVVVDAQRNEFYVARYEISPSACREIEPLRIAVLAEVQAREAAGEMLIGPEVTRWFASGKIISPHAATLARLAAARNDFVSGEKLEPIYLRETAFVKAPPLRVID